MKIYEKNFDFNDKPAGTLSRIFLYENEAYIIILEELSFDNPNYSCLWNNRLEINMTYGEARNLLHFLGYMERGKVEDDLCIKTGYKPCENKIIGGCYREFWSKEDVSNSYFTSGEARRD